MAASMWEPQRRCEPIELKRFDVRDGIGIRLLAQAGLQLAIVSGRISQATSLRAVELGIDEVHQDAGGAARFRSSPN